MAILGIDPKNDFAFKCVFGSDQHKGILVHMLNAVLDPPPGQHVQSVVNLNPFTERLALDDKLSILDIRAVDQTGRSFNVEMQMVPHSGLRGRLLYYWAKLYCGQLQSGDQYEELMPTISICFFDGLLTAQPDTCRLFFRLWDAASQVPFSEHLEMYVFQLPRFTKRAEDLSDALDLWLYFLNNAKGLDPDNLPAPLQIPEVVEAMTVLRSVTQEEWERELYLGRERARRDALYREHRDKTLDEREAKVAEQEAKVAEHAAKVAESQAKVAEREAELEQREAKLRQRAVALQERVAELQQRQDQLQQQEAELLRRAAELEQLENRLRDP